MKIKFLAGFLLALCTAFPLNAQEWEARLMDVSGEVHVLSHTSPEQYYAAEKNLPLESGDVVQTGADGSCEIALEDGNLLKINSGTEFKVERLEKEDTSFTVSFGSLLAKLAGLVENKSRVEFKTPTAVAAVRGTELGVEALEDQSHFGVFDEGKVEVNHVNGGQPVILTQNSEPVLFRLLDEIIELNPAMLLFTNKFVDVHHSAL